ncbi:hypothetical protein N9N21_02510 [Alphaproteobacteria bacterium]|nr:hypothetical protein [Alphaproteobacteria bacterium]
MAVLAGPSATHDEFAISPIHSTTDLPKNMFGRNKLMMLVKTACAHHKQRFGRISCIKMTAAFAAKTLQPLITTFGNFQKFGYRA